MKTSTILKLNESWLHLKYDNGEINTNIPYIAVENPDFFAQGDDASQIILEIHKHWLKGGATQEESFNWWVNIYL